MSHQMSIVISTYRRPLFLKRVLDSIEKQTVKNFEVIVVDDGSPEWQQNQEVVKGYLFPVTYLRNEENRGDPYSKNRGILAAQSDWVAFVDDDDEWFPTKLERQGAYLNDKDPSLGLVYTWTKVFKNNVCIRQEQPCWEGHALKHLLKSNFIPCPSVVVRKKAIIDAGLFDPDFPNCQDWDVWVRMLAKGYTCQVVKSFETIYHKHDCGSMGELETASEGYRKFYQKHLPLYRTYDPAFYYKTLMKNYVKKGLSLFLKK